MKYLIWTVLLCVLLCVPARAMDFTAPQAPAEVQREVEDAVRDSGRGIWALIRTGLEAVDSSLHQALQSALRICCAVMLGSVIRQISGKSAHFAAELACTLSVAVTLLHPSSAWIRLGAETIRKMNDYGKLLLPVMTGALAAQGGFQASASLYAATAFFNAMLSAAITRLLIPVLYLVLALSVGYAAVGEELLGRFRDFLSWFTVWFLKLTLYLFTGFLAVTGVIGGSADAAALKAAKITISGAVPVVGSILSDATEAVLVSAGVMRSAAGLYGLFTVMALCLGPFFQMGVQYLMLKAVSALCAAFDRGRTSGLLQDFSAVMGMMLAMIATQTVMILISTVCFMKGAG